MADHVTKHSYQRQAHQSWPWPEEGREQVSDEWCSGLLPAVKTLSPKHALPEAHVTLTTVSYHRVEPTCTLIMYARLQQITNTPLKPIARNPRSGLCRPINAEHLLYGGSTLQNLRAVFRSKAASCLLQQFLWLEKACDGVLRLNQINPFYRDSFSGFLVKLACLCSCLSPDVFSAKFNRRLGG